MTILIDIAVRTSVILLAALLATTAMRRAAAATRHLAWTLAIVAVLMLPVLMFVLPDWHVVPALVRGDHARIPTDIRPPMGTIDSDDGSLDSATRVLGIWTSVVGIFLIRIYAGARGVRRLARHARPADARLRAVLTDACSIARVHRSIRLLVSSDITTPITWGSTRPLLLLPQHASSWSDERLRVVLLHEVTHIRRRDSLTHALARVVAAIHWFNPLVWIALRAMTRERERAVDDCVVTAGTSASSYAQLLLDLACGDIQSSVWSIAPAMARRGELEGRLIALLTPHRRKAGIHAAPVLTAIAVVSAGLVAAAAPKTDTQAAQTRPARPSSFASVARADQMSADRREAYEDHAVRRALIGALTDPSEDVRESATIELAGHSESDIVEPLLRALKDTSAQVREKAAMGLAFRRQPRVVDALLEAAADTDPQVREKAVFALGFSGDARAVPALTAAAKDSDAQVREKAVLGLAVHGR